MAKSSLSQQAAKKKQWLKWFLYQLIVVVTGTSLIVGYVYVPNGGWKHKWQTILTALNENISVPFHMLLKRSDSANKTNPASVPLYNMFHSTKPSYTIQAALHTNEHMIQASEDVFVPNLNDSHIEFYLFTEDHQPIKIQSVSINQKPVHFSVSNFALQIELPSRVSHTTVHISFQTPILQGGFRYGEIDQVWTIGYWYPILGVRNSQRIWIQPPKPKGFGDPFLEDNADYDITWTAPATFKWFTTGTLLAAKEEGTSKISEWKIANVRNFALVGSPNFTDHPFTTNSGTDIHIVTLMGHNTHLQTLKSIATTAINLYTNTFGLYYYPELSIIEMPPGTVFAHEYPGLALFSTDIWQWPSGEHWIAHEIAHGWWYHSVGDYEAETEWLDEGLAEYSSLLYLENRYGKDAYEQQLKKLWGLWLAQQSYLPDSEGTPLQTIHAKVDQPYSTFESAEEYYYITYLRTTLMYADLREKMGDQKFFNWLQQFYLKNSGHVATRQSLTKALQDIAPTYIPLFNQWLDSPNDILIQTERKDRIHHGKAK